MKGGLLSRQVPHEPTKTEDDNEMIWIAVVIGIVLGLMSDVGKVGGFESDS